MSVAFAEGTVVVERNYEPTEKAALAHACSAGVQVWVGGMGSGKSRIGIEEVIQSGLDYPGIPMAMYRKTMPALRDSSMHEFRQTVPSEIGDWREREDKFQFLTGSFCNFRGLDDPNKAKSTEYALIVIEEADEMTFEDFMFLNGRVRKKGNWPLRIILILNPVDEHHWIYKQFVQNAAVWEKAGGLAVFHFSTYDNLQNLPPGYIEKNTAGMSPDMIDRYVHGKWGTIVKGTPVYASILNADIHLRKVDYAEGLFTLARGWDFGFNHPACSFRLIDGLGRKNINHEVLGEKEALEDFARRIVEVTAQKYGRDVQTFDYCDPRGHDKSDKGESSVEILRGLGIWAQGERGVRDYVEPGIQLVRKEFQTLIQGVPELTIDPRCTMLRAAYFAKYVRGDDGKPVKDGFYDHLCDADRYIAYHHKSNSAVKEAILARKQNRPHAKANKYTGYCR